MNIWLSYKILYIKWFSKAPYRVISFCSETSFWNKYILVVPFLFLTKGVIELLPISWMNCKREEDLTCDNIGKPINIFNFIAIILFSYCRRILKVTKVHKWAQANSTNVIWWPRNMLFFTNHETCIKTRTTLVFKI